MQWVNTICHTCFPSVNETQQHYTCQKNNEHCDCRVDFQTCKNTTSSNQLAATEIHPETCHCDNSPPASGLTVGSTLENTGLSMVLLLCLPNLFCNSQVTFLMSESFSYELNENSLKKWTLFIDYDVLKQITSLIKIEVVNENNC